MRGRISLGVLALVLAASQPAPAQGTKGFDGFKLVDKQGNISKPADYRDRYELVGTYTVLDRRVSSPIPVGLALGPGLGDGKYADRLIH